MTRATRMEEVSQTAMVIEAYTRVIDTCTKIVKEGIPLPQEVKEITGDAWAGLARSVSYLRFLGENRTE